AKKKPIETVSLSDLNTESTDITTPRSIMLEVAMRPPRAAGMKIVDEGDAGQKLATFLVENRLA
ncbi:MAG: electron transfer flavoprotein subunit beta, partial [Microbacterium sp.]